MSWAEQDPDLEQGDEGWSTRIEFVKIIEGIADDEIDFLKRNDLWPAGASGNSLMFGYRDRRYDDVASALREYDYHKKRGGRHLIF